VLLLTATADTQRLQLGDFCDAIEGELVVIFADCHIRGHQDHLLQCREGCPPLFFGLNSLQRTTTAMIRDMPVSREHYLLALSSYAKQRGLPAPQVMACGLGMQMLNAAVTHLPGTVMGFTAGKLTDRAVPRAGWRNVATTASAMARSFAWRRYYQKTIVGRDTQW
jgi:hypothetical protein